MSPEEANLLYYTVINWDQHRWFQGDLWWQHRLGGWRRKVVEFFQHKDIHYLFILLVSFIFTTKWFKWYKLNPQFKYY